MRVGQDPQEESQAVSTTLQADRKHEQLANLDMAVSAPGAQFAPPGARTAPAPNLAVDPAGVEARERDQLLDRLASLRRVLPALAQEMASARRQAAHLRGDNRRLSEQVRQLRAELEARSRSGHAS
jgi:chromosome segregation ATPase